jgi:hypothetical protein
MGIFVTLYRTDELKDFPEGEYFQPRLEVEMVDGKEVFFVRETHAYFNNKLKVRRNEVTTFSPDEGYATRKEAQERYDQQIQRRVKDGFFHCFYFDPFKGDGVGYENLAKGK